MMRAGWRPRWGRWAAAAVILAAAAGAAVAGVSGAFGARSRPVAGSGNGTGTAVVTRQSLTSQTQVDGTLGDAGSYNVVVPPSGSSGSGSGTAPGSGSGSKSGAGAGPGTTGPPQGEGPAPGPPARSPAPSPSLTPSLTPSPSPSPSPSGTGSALYPGMRPGTAASGGPSPSGSRPGSPPLPYRAYQLDSWSRPGSPVSGSGSGTFTWLPAVGQTMRQGQVAYRVSGRPVVLLYGQVPIYRGLAEGTKGADVAQLNHDLVALGYATRPGVTSAGGWDYFSWHTAGALEHLQARLGQARTGSLGLGTAVFLPGPVLITALGSTAVLGGPATPGSVVATASSRTPVVTIDLDVGMQSEVGAGDRVSITLPDGPATSGVVSQISTVASASASGSGPGGSSGPEGGPVTVTVTVSLDHPRAAGSLDAAPVTVEITTGSVRDVLAVPVDALLAQPGSGYAVEVIGAGGGRRLVKVTPGLFDDATGEVAVTGSLLPGQRVVVPGS